MFKIGATGVFTGLMVKDETAGRLLVLLSTAGASTGAGGLLIGKFAASLAMAPAIDNFFCKIAVADGVTSELLTDTVTKEVHVRILILCVIKGKNKQ